MKNIDNITLAKIKDVLFFLMCLSLPFTLIPKPIQINFLGGSVGGKLLFYPLFIGIILTLWQQYKYQNIFAEWGRFKKYILIYVIIIFISLIHGLYIYPYYDLINNGPTDQIEKLPKVISALDALGIDANINFLTTYWIVIRTIKYFFLEIIYTFGCSYMIFCWYSDNWKRAFNIFLKALALSLVLTLVYGMIDFGYLAGNGYCRSILIFLNPYVHVINDNGTWWPPILWKERQLRSLFAEPSYFGMYAAFVQPFLWYYLLKNNKNMLAWTSAFVLMFFVILTKSRTAVLLMWGEIGLLFVGVVLQKKMELFKHLLWIMAISLLAFLCGIYFPLFVAARIISANNISVPKANILAHDYVDENVASVSGTKQRSNRSRYAILAANISIGKQHPILGVGTSLRHAYIKDNLPSWGYNDEIKMWLRNQKEKGILNSGFPNLCDFAVRFSETGIVGLGLFLFPLFFLFQLLYKSYKRTKRYKDIILFFVISLVASTIVGFGDGLNILYAYWILLGLGYTICYGILRSAER